MKKVISLCLREIYLPVRFMLKKGEPRVPRVLLDNKMTYILLKLLKLSFPSRPSCLCGRQYPRTDETMGYLSLGIPVYLFTFPFI